MTADSAPQAGVTVTLAELQSRREQVAGKSLTRLKPPAAISNGGRRTRATGRGMEYAESRAYVAGDDVRTMDWRVMARTGEPHTKLFAEQRQRSYIVAVDLSCSMFFGTRYSFKSWAAAQLAACASWMIIQSGDYPGAAVAAGGHCRYASAARGKSALQSLFQWLTEDANRDLPTTTSQRCLTPLLHTLNRRQQTASTIVLISDFLSLDAQSVAAAQALARRHQLICCWVYDRTEVEPWAGGDYPVVLNGQPDRLNTLDRHTANWLQRQQQTHRRQIESAVASCNAVLLPISCNHDITSQLPGPPTAA